MGPSSVIFSRSSQLFPFDERGCGLGVGCLDFSTNYHFINKAFVELVTFVQCFFPINRLYVRLTNPIKGFKMKFSCYGISMKWYLYYVPILSPYISFFDAENHFLLILCRFNNFFQISTRIYNIRIV